MSESREHELLDGQPLAPHARSHQAFQGVYVILEVITRIYIYISTKECRCNLEVIIW